MSDKNEKHTEMYEEIMRLVEKFEDYDLESFEEYLRYRLEQMKWTDFLKLRYKIQDIADMFNDARANLIIYWHDQSEIYRDF